MNRRDFLSSAPVALTVTAAPVAVAAQCVVGLDENPALLALAQQLPEVEQAYVDTLKAEREAWRIWSPQWPLAPEACCNKWGASGYNRDLERNLRGAGLRREGQSTCWTIKTASEMERDIERAHEMLAKDDKRKRSYGKKFRQYRHEEIAEAELGLLLLPGYLAECERIKRESRYMDLVDANSSAREAMFNFVREVLAEQARTMEGVVIKARACAAIGRMTDYDQSWGQMVENTTHRKSMAGLLGAALLEVI